MSNKNLTFLSLIIIWLGVLIACIFGKPLISGSQQEVLRIGLVTLILGGLFATKNVFENFKIAKENNFNNYKVVIISSIVIWLIVIIGSIFAPSFITGSDPTSLPLFIIFGPFLGSYFIKLSAQFIIFLKEDV